MTPQEIRTIRRTINLNTRNFGALVGVSGRAIENWEQGRRKPGGAAVVIMRRLAESATKG